MTSGVGLDLLREVEQFLFREARLCDANAYDEWLGLWTTPCTYWVPCNQDDGDPAATIAIIYDGRGQLEDRVWRLKGLHAHAQRPRSRLARVISNVEIDRIDGSETVVHAAFVLTEVRKDEQRVWSGRTTHVLVRTAGGLAIQSKKVLLVNNDSAVPNLTFLI